MEAVVVALITAGIPAIVTLWTSHNTKKSSEKHAAKSSILQMILEDKMAVMEGKLPENHQNILSEFDEYVTNGGNSYLHQKVNDYEEWYKDITKTTKKQG